MKHAISIKQRDTGKRKDKSVFLIIAEGKNKTETNYLKHFQEQGKEFIIQFVKAGNNTDAESLYRTLANTWEKKEL